MVEPFAYSLCYLGKQILKSNGKYFNVDKSYTRYTTDN